MQDSKRPIQIIAIIGLALAVLSFLISCLTVIIPETILRLIRAPQEIIDAADTLRNPLLLIAPAIKLPIHLAIWHLINQQVKYGKGKAETVALIAAVVLVAAPLVNLYGTQLINIIFTRLYSLSAFAALSYVSSVRNYAAVSTYIAIPAFTAAAAMNWYRVKYLPQ